MKPAPVAYARAATVDHALALLADAGEDAKLLAGGQSLMPLMNFRLARPTHLIDINDLSDLAWIESTEDGRLLVGALTRHAALERAPELVGPWRALREAAANIGHHPIRVRGTFGGSIAHADPSAELPVAAVALDARFRLRSGTGERTVPAGEFFLGPFTTALEPDEMVVCAEFPTPPRGMVSAFEEFAVHSGDFALASAAVAVALDDHGLATHVRIALGGVGPTPLRVHAAEDALAGSLLTEQAVGTAAYEASTGCSPAEEDPRYRCDLVRAMVARALRRCRPQEPT
jgi:CO/xanthine dehydrogenase FAD-binding subunit